MKPETTVADPLADLAPGIANAVTMGITDSNLSPEEALRANERAEQIYDAVRKMIPKIMAQFTKINQAIGRFFRTTQIVLEPAADAISLADHIKKHLPTKEEGGMFDYRDSDILGWNKNNDEPLPARAERMFSTVSRFQENMTHKQIIDEATGHGFFKRYNIRDGVELVAKLVAAGEIEERNKGVIIYLEEGYREDGISCRLHVWRNGDGELGVYVYGVDPGREWDAGCGACFS